MRNEIGWDTRCLQGYRCGKHYDETGQQDHPHLETPSSTLDTTTLLDMN
jgi:hypothetical protein